VSGGKGSSDPATGKSVPPDIAAAEWATRAIREMLGPEGHETPANASVKPEAPGVVESARAGGGSRVKGRSGNAENHNIPPAGPPPTGQHGPADKLRIAPQQDRKDETVLKTQTAAGVKVAEKGHGPENTLSLGPKQPENPQSTLNPGPSNTLPQSSSGEIKPASGKSEGVANMFKTPAIPPSSETLQAKAPVKVAEPPTGKDRREETMFKPPATPQPELKEDERLGALGPSSEQLAVQQPVSGAKAGEEDAPENTLSLGSNQAGMPHNDDSSAGSSPKQETAGVQEHGRSVGEISRESSEAKKAAKTGKPKKVGRIM